jgi:glycerol dehydrogenase
MTILSQQPARLLVAGACDAMAKKIEIEFWNSIPCTIDNPVSCDIASLISDYIYADLDRKIDAAVEDLRQGKPTQTLKEVVFSAIVGAGIVSGISGGARQTALAHGFYFFARSRYAEKAVRYTHGELVAAGLVLQLAYYGRVPDAERFAARLRGWGLAASMGDLGFSFGEEDAEACMEYLCGMDEMKAAGADAVPKLREALKVVFR